MKNGIDVDEYGTVRHYVNGKLHRGDGPALEALNGDKIWCQYGKYHRLDGPAIEFGNGTKFWYYNDKRHRLDGPAIEHVNGTKQWYIDGKQIYCSSQKEFEKLAVLKVFW